LLRSSTRLSNVSSSALLVRNKSKCLIWNAMVCCNAFQNGNHSENLWLMPHSLSIYKVPRILPNNTQYTQVNIDLYMIWRAPNIKNTIRGYLFLSNDVFLKQ
jgi:hypothetical protein